MKQLLLASVLMLLSISMFAQTPVGQIRVAGASAVFTSSLPVGTKIFQVDTKQNWVVTTAILANGTANISNSGASLLEIVPLTKGLVDNTSMKITTSALGVASSPASQLVTISQAIPGAPGVGLAGLISGADQLKLNNISGNVGVFNSESFEETADALTGTDHSLAHEIKSGTSVLVSINGVALKSSLYTITESAGVATKVKVNIPVNTYDLIVYTYTY